MATATLPEIKPQSALDAKFSRSPGKLGIIIFGAIMIVGVLYAGSSLVRDLSNNAGSGLQYLLLGIALLVALAFEFEIGRAHV